MSQAIVKPTTDKDVLRILGNADDRELLDAAENDAFMPYDTEFSIEADLLALRVKKNYDNEGVFVTFKVTASNNPEVKVNKLYTIAFFEVHKSVPEFVLKSHLLLKRAFAVAVAGVQDTPEFKAAPVLLKLARATQENDLKGETLDIPMLIQNKYLKTTRNQKKIHQYRFARDPRASAPAAE